MKSAGFSQRQDQMESSLASVKDQQIQVESNEESCKSRLSSVEGEISSIRQGCFLAVFSSTHSITGGLPQQRHWVTLDTFTIGDPDIGAHLSETFMPSIICPI